MLPAAVCSMVYTQGGTGVYIYRVVYTRLYTRVYRVWYREGTLYIHHLGYKEDTCIYTT